MEARRGFTLVEIVVSLGLTLIIAGAVYRLVTGAQRLSQAQEAQLSLQSTVRAGILVAGNELRGLSTVSGGAAFQNDIVSMAPNGITYRASRGVGFLCQAPTGTQLRIARTGFSGFRDPQPGRDVVYVFRAGASPAGEEDTWLPLGIVSITTSTACPPGFGAGITIATSGSGWPPEISAGTPIRFFELMELKAYQSEGQWWLGTRSVSSGEVIQPIAGPLSGPDGFQLRYLSRSGSQTIDPSAVASIRITLRGTSEALRRAQTSTADEELTTQVTLRNGPLR
jgi:prepilin-type N-terminal cleavage/methylation domain-containing protein